MAIAPKQIGKVYNVPDAPAGLTGTMTFPSPVETYRLVRFRQNSPASVTVALPNPTDTSIEFAIDVINMGPFAITLHGFEVSPLEGMRLGWNTTGWGLVAGPMEIKGDQQSSTTTPTTRSRGRPLQAGDIWFHPTTGMTRIYDGTSWTAINEPFRTIGGLGTVITTKTENLIVRQIGCNITLNPTPVDGEKVEVYFYSGWALVVAPFQGGGGPLTLNASSVKRATFVYNATATAWMYDLVSALSIVAPSFSTGTLAARPAVGTADGDIYKVVGDATSSNNDRVFAWDAGTASWNEINAALFDSGAAVTRPSNAADGFIFYATDTGVMSIYDLTNTTWRTIGNGAVVSSTNPSIDNSVARYDLTTGQIIQGSLVTISDVGDVTGVRNIYVSGQSSAKNNAAVGGIINCSSGNFFNFSVTPGLAQPVNFIAQPAAGTAYIATLVITLSSTASVLWPASVRWPGGTAPTLSPSKTHVVTVMTIDGGTNWYATALADY